MEEKKEFEASMHKSGNVCCSTDGGISQYEPSLEVSVEECLSGNYPNLGGAYREVRACIENYVRFKKGVDLNDGFFYEGKETVKNKFALAGVDQEMMDKLIPIYVRAHPFVHDDPSVMGLSAERVREEMAYIRECVRLFKEMKIDRPDFQNGLPFLYNCRNARLKALLDGSGDPKALDTVLKEKLFIFFKNMRSLEEGMKNRGIAIPDVKFKTAEDVYDYLAVRRTAKTPEEATREERECALEYYRKMADNGSFSACLVLGNYCYGAGEGEKAIDWYKRALNMDNSAEEISRMMAGTMLIISKRLIAAKEYADALKLLDGMTAVSETFVLAGDCYYHLGELDAAFEKYRLAEPSHILGNELKLFIATRLISADPKAAMEYFKLCDAPEKDIGVMLGMGECCLRLGALTSAVKYYRNAIKLNEREPSEEISKRIADTVYGTVTFEQAWAYGKKPENKDPYIVRSLADILWDTGNRYRATEWYERYADKCNDSRVSYRLGEYYLESSRVHGSDSDMASAAKWINGDITFYRNNETVVTQMVDYYRKNAPGTSEHMAWSRALLDIVNRKGLTMVEAIPIYEKCDTRVLGSGLQRDIGDHYLKCDRVGKAVDWYLTCAQYKGDYDFLKEKADAIRRGGDHDQAARMYELYVRHVRSAETLKLLGDHYFSTDTVKSIGFYDEYCEMTQSADNVLVRKIIDRCEGLSDKKPAAKWYKRYGDILFAEGDKEGAVKAYTVCSDGMFDASAERALAEYYYEKEEWGNAFEHYLNICKNSADLDEDTVNRAITVCGKTFAARYDTKSQTRYRNDMRRLSQIKGNVLYARGEKDGAFAEYIKSTADGTPSRYEKIATSVTYRRIIEYYLEKGEPSEAEKWCIQSFVDPRERKLLKAFGEAFEAKGDSHNAIKYYEAYRKETEYSAIVYYNPRLGGRKPSGCTARPPRYHSFSSVPMEKTEDSKTRQKLFEYIADGYGKEYPEILRRMISLYAAVGNVGQKNIALKRLGEALCAVGDYSGAVEAYAQGGIRIADPEYQRVIGDHLFDLGKRDEAIGWYEQCLSDKANISVANRIAEYYREKGQRDKISDLHERCMKLHGSSPIEAEITEERGKSAEKSDDSTENATVEENSAKEEKAAIPKQEERRSAPQKSGSKKKKVLVACAFCLLILFTAPAFIMMGVDSYFHDMDPANGVDLLEGFGAVLLLIFGGAVVFYEIDLFYTVWYFAFSKKKKWWRSVINVLSHSLLAFAFIYFIAAEFFIMELRRYEMIPLILFFTYLVLRCVGMVISECSANREEK